MESRTQSKTIENYKQNLYDLAYKDFHFSFDYTLFCENSIVFINSNWWMWRYNKVVTVTGPHLSVSIQPHLY